MPTQFVNDEGIAQVLMINEGQGSSAYYEKEQLARDGSAFDGGLVFIDHPGRQESKDRPERSLKDLVGPIVGTPTFDENGSEGPGLYAGVKVAPWWKPFLEHHGPDIGASIRAGGSVRYEEKGGKRVKVCEKFNPGAGFDFVTQAGRGGKMVAQALDEAGKSVDAWMSEEAFVESDGRSEEARFLEWMDRTDSGEGEDMSEKLQTQLTEANAKLETQQEVLDESGKENARLTEALALREGRDIVDAALNDPKVKMPDATRLRLAESISKATPIVEGKVDRPALEKLIAESIESELKYITEIAPKGQYGVKGMGESASGGEEDDEEAHTKLFETKKAEYMRKFRDEGKATRAAEIFVDGLRG